MWQLQSTPSSDFGGVAVATLQQQHQYLTTALNRRNGTVARLLAKLSTIEADLSEKTLPRKEKRRLHQSRFKLNKSLQTCKNEEKMLKESFMDCVTRIQAWQNAAAHQQNTHYADVAAMVAPYWDTSPYQGFVASAGYDASHYRHAGALHSPGHICYTPTGAAYEPSTAASTVSVNLNLTLPSMPAQSVGFPFVYPPYPNVMDNMYTYYQPYPGVSYGNNMHVLSSISSTSTLVPEEQRHDVAFHPGSAYQESYSASPSEPDLRTEAASVMPTSISHKRWLSEDIPISPCTVLPPRRDRENPEHQRRYSAAAVDLILNRLKHPPSRPGHGRHKSEYKEESATALQEEGEGTPEIEQ